MKIRRVLVTGAAGNIGSRLVPLLLDDPEIEQVYGVDAAPCALPPRPGWTPVQADVRDPALRSLVGESDCLVHLAFVVKNLHDDARAREINLDGTENLLAACEGAPRKRVVFTSSVSVYGYHAENRGFLKEGTPLRPDPNHVYSTCKVSIEQRLGRLGKEFPGISICILRPALVLGPEVDNSLANLFRKGHFLCVKGFDPRVQGVQVDDMARALQSAVKGSVSGVFNVAAADALRVSEICRIFRIRRIQVPRGLFEGFLRLAYRAGVSHIPPESVSRFLYSLTVDAALFRRVFHWEPAHSTLRCIARLRYNRISR